jgi:hypothetical protein
LPQNPDLLVEVVDLLIFLVSAGTEIRIIYIDNFDGNNLFAATLTSDLMSAEVELRFKID